MTEPTTIGAPAGDNANPGQGGQRSVADENGQGDLPEREWVQDLPEPLKASKTLRKFTDSDWKPGLAKAYVELEGKLGTSIQVPDANAKPEEWEKFFSRVGRPGKPDEYDVSGGKLNPDFESKLKAAAFAKGYTKAQYAAAIATITESNEAAMAAYRSGVEAESKAATAALKTAYGPDYDAMIAQADVAISAIIPASALEAFKASGIMNNVDFVQSMVKFGLEFKDTEFIKGTSAVVKKDDGYDWVREKYPAQ